MNVDSTFKELKDGISSTLVDTTRTAGQISNEDLAFYRSSNPSIVPLLERQSARLLRLAQRLTKSATSETEITTPSITDVESVEDNWKSIVDVLDNLLEKADACLDEYTGAVRRLSPSQEDRGKNTVPPTGKLRPDKVYRTQNIPKPQLLFATVPKNDERTVFRPLLCSKPHAVTPLEESLSLAPTSDGSQQYKHPYEIEIKQSGFPAGVSAQSEPIPYLPLESTKATLVDTLESLHSMLHELKSAKEIAVDLEHHDEHSYIGLVSLMQISTRDKDWIVDTLKPWRQELQALNEVFVDPKILKVFHGAFMDMIWLQRDFGLYVVGLFDTYHASRSLGYPKHGLAYLLKRFAGFDAAKQYQMADWRIRPLPEDMFNYARSDTHFLLYIYDNVRNELISKSDRSQVDGDLINAVMENSKEESLQRYERPLYDMQHGLGAMGWYNLLCRTPALFNREQFAVFRAAHQWRDTIARQEDEGVHTIMSKNNLYNIARETPVDMPSLLRCAHPMSQIFRERKADLLHIIKQAKMKGSTGPDMKEVMENVQSLNGERNMVANGESNSSSIPPPPPERPLPLRIPEKSNSTARTETSLFWGPAMPNSSDSKAREIRSHGESLRLALPLPQLTAELYQDPKTVAADSQARPGEGPGAHVKHEYVKGKKAKQENIIIVKRSGGSRKRNITELDDDINTKSSAVIHQATSKENEDVSETGLHADARSMGSSAELSEKKLLKKAKKKAKKEARKLETMQLRQAAASTSTVEPFDYTNAPSVLNPKRNGDVSGGRGEIKPENPYLKSMNAPKGIPKTRVEGGGKSMTYKD